MAGRLDAPARRSRPGATPGFGQPTEFGPRSPRPTGLLGRSRLSAGLGGGEDQRELSAWLAHARSARSTVVDGACGRALRGASSARGRPRPRAGPGRRAASSKAGDEPVRRLEDDERERRAHRLDDTRPSARLSCLVESPKTQTHRLAMPDADERREDGGAARDRLDPDAARRWRRGTSSRPGSESSGVPASVTSAIDSPGLQARRAAAGVRVVLVVLVQADGRGGNPEMGRAAGPSGGCPRRRSAATSRSTRSARSVMSSRLPIGVDTTKSVPVGRGACDMARSALQSRRPAAEENAMENEADCTIGAASGPARRPVSPAAAAPPRHGSMDSLEPLSALRRRLSRLPVRAATDRGDLRRRPRARRPPRGLHARGDRSPAARSRRLRAAARRTSAPTR